MWGEKVDVGERRLMLGERLWGENEGGWVQMTETSNGILVLNYIYREMYTILSPHSTFN